MKIDLLDKTKKKKFLEGLSYLGKLKARELLIKTGKERIRAYSGAFSNEEIWDFWRIFPVEGIGVYLGKENIDKHGVREIRLSIEGLHLLGGQISEGILVLDEKQEEEWFLGKEVEVGGEQVKDLKAYFVAVKSASSGDFIGIGKLNKDKDLVYNYLPKERRRKERGS
jgi:NOL1/NOP2/fmu family ribosome biogenesis protein